MASSLIGQHCVGSSCYDLPPPHAARWYDVVIAQSKHRAVHIRGGAAFQLSQLRDQAGALDRILGQSSVKLSRLLSIAQTHLRFQAGHAPSAKPASPLIRSKKSAWPLIMSLQPSTPLNHNHRSSQMASGPVSRRVVSRPVGELHPLPYQPVSLKSYAHAAVGHAARNEAQQISKMGSRRANPTALLTPGSRQISHKQSMALKATALVPVYRFPPSRKIVGRYRAPPEYARAATHQVIPAVAPSSNRFLDDGTSGLNSPLVSLRTDRIQSALQVRISTAFGDNTPPSRADRIQASNDSRREIRHGDLYLEGSVLGRWLIQHLNREIIRPRSGMMAVDPRITPPWGASSLAM